MKTVYIVEFSPYARPSVHRTMEGAEKRIAEIAIQNNLPYSEEEGGYLKPNGHLLFPFPVEIEE